MRVAGSMGCPDSNQEKYCSIQQNWISKRGWRCLRCYRQVPLQCLWCTDLGQLVCRVPVQDVCLRCVPSRLWRHGVATCTSLQTKWKSVRLMIQVNSATDQQHCREDAVGWGMHHSAALNVWLSFWCYNRTHLRHVSKLFLSPEFTMRAVIFFPTNVPLQFRDVLWSKGCGQPSCKASAGLTGHFFALKTSVNSCVLSSARRPWPEYPRIKIRDLASEI